MPGERTRPSFLILACTIGAVLLLLLLVGSSERISFQPRAAFEPVVATNPDGGTMEFRGTDGFVLFFRVLFVLALAAWVYQLLISRVSRRVYLILAALAAIVVMILLWVSNLDPAEPAPIEIDAELGEAVQEGEAPPLVEPEYEASDTDYVLLAIILSSTAVLIGAILLWRWLRSRRPEGVIQDTAALYDSLSEAAHRIRMGEDPYTVVLFCYQEMIRILSKIGHINATYLTPREFEQSLSDFGVSDIHIRQLTEIFEAVRYGAKLDDAFPTRALACLDAIQGAHQST